MKLAVCILNWNGIQYTTKCVESLLRSSSTDFDIHILDNGSTQDEAVQLQQQFSNRVSVTRNSTNLGFAEGYNHLLRSIRDLGYSHYILLNQDALVDAHCISHLVEYARNHPKCAAIGPAVLNEQNATIQSVGARINLYTGKISSEHQGEPATVLANLSPHVVNVVLGNCMLISQEAWDMVGEFDSSYFAYYEEADWCMRAKLMNIDCHSVPTAIVTHSKAGGFRTYLVLRNMIWFVQKFASPWQRVVFFLYYWIVVLERLKKGSPLREIIAATNDGWRKRNIGKPYRVHV